jgi:hypothetical protein
LKRQAQKLPRAIRNMSELRKSGQKLRNVGGKKKQLGELINKG